MPNDFYNALQEVQQIPKVVRELLENFTIFINAKKNTLSSAQAVEVFKLEDASTHAAAENALKSIEDMLVVLCGLAEVAMPTAEPARKFLFFSTPQKVKVPAVTAKQEPAQTAAIVSTTSSKKNF